MMLLIGSRFKRNLFFTKNGSSLFMWGNQILMEQRIPQFKLQTPTPPPPPPFPPFRPEPYFPVTIMPIGGAPQIERYFNQRMCYTSLLLLLSYEVNEVNVSKWKWYTLPRQNNYSRFMVIPAAIISWVFRLIWFVPKCLKFCNNHLNSVKLTHYSLE